MGGDAVRVGQEVVMTFSWSTRVAVSGLAAATLSLPAGVAAGAVRPALLTPAATTATVTVSPDSYADQLVRAWGRGDGPAAETLATSAVVAELFAYSTPGGVSWRRIGSSGAAGTIFVTYHDDARGGTVTLGVSDVVLSQGQQHAVYRVQFSQARPIDATEYADRLVRAWGRGDRTASSTYATSATVAALFGHADPGGGFWARTGAEGAAGTVYVTYGDNTGQQLVLR